MTSRERLLTTLAHQEADRCATYIWIVERALEALEARLGVKGKREVERALKIDSWAVVRAETARPADFEARARSLIPEDLLGREDAVLLEDGRLVEKHPDATYLEDVLWHPLQGMVEAAELEAFPFPAPDDLADLDGLPAQIQELKDTDCLVAGMTDQPCKIACVLRGMTNFMADYHLNPDIVEGIYDRLWGFNTAAGIAYAKAGADVVQVVGDIAMQDRLMMSPDTWRRFDKPRMAHLVEEVKAVNPDVKVYMHSDGCLTEIVPDLVEMGLDILNPIQPECMDPVAMKQEWGDRLVLHGAMSLQRTIPFGTPQQVKDEARFLIEHCGRGGGFVLGPSNMLLPEFPIENILAMYEAVGDL